MTKICLTSIVKNESKIILRLLESVLPIVDYVCISDTGSTDDTVPKVKRYLKNKKVKFDVYEDKWSDFGTNRTLSIKNAWKSFPDADYLLFLDADMVLKIDEKFDKNSLTHDFYKVVQKNPNITYYNIRLVKKGNDWVCVGRTHEYYDVKDGDKFELTSANLDTIYIDDREDGGSKADKYIRDYQLLKKDYEEDNSAERTYFYLAQTCGSLRKYDEAVEWYLKRSEAGGYEEEAWYSLLRIGDIYRDTGEHDKAIMYYLKAHRRRPFRAEPSYKAALMFSNLKDYQSCYTYAVMASEIPWPHMDSLFIDNESHTFGPYFLIGISAFYINKLKEGVDGIFRFLSMNPPQHLKNIAVSNLSFYCKKYGFEMKTLTE